MHASGEAGLSCLKSLPTRTRLLMSLMEMVGMMEQT